VRVPSTADILWMTAMTIASGIDVDDMVVVDIHRVYEWGLSLVKWGLSLSVPSLSPLLTGLRTISACCSIISRPAGMNWFATKLTLEQPCIHYKPSYLGCDPLACGNGRLDRSDYHGSCSSSHREDVPCRS